MAVVKRSTHVGHRASQIWGRKIGGWRVAEVGGGVRLVRRRRARICALRRVRSPP